MKEEYTAEDFARGVKNPYFHMLNKKVTVTVKNEIYDIYAEIAEQNDEPIEAVMNRTLAVYSKALQEAE